MTKQDLRLSLISENAPNIRDRRQHGVMRVQATGGQSGGMTASQGITGRLSAEIFTGLGDGMWLVSFFVCCDRHD